VKAKRRLSFLKVICEDKLCNLYMFLAFSELTELYIYIYIHIYVFLDKHIFIYTLLNML